VLIDRALRTAFTTRGAPAKDLPPDASFPPERVCRVEAEIARGGMGVVYRARDPALGREVALKLLREDLAADEGAVRRFLEEARVGGRLQHPGVVPVYALGRTATGRPGSR
jgi:serine/threonine-protein kinase